jgi:hypothetical protein
MPIIWKRTLKGRYIPLEQAPRIVAVEGGGLMLGRETHLAYCKPLPSKNGS